MENKNKLSGRRGFNETKLPNPTGKGGFGDNPQNRSDGGWKKEYTPTYQYKRFLNMDIDELMFLSKCWGIVKLDPADYKDERFQNPENKKRTTVEEMCLRRVIASMRSLSDVKEINDRVEGRAMQKVEASVKTDFADYSDEQLEKLGKALSDGKDG